MSSATRPDPKKALIRLGVAAGIIFGSLGLYAKHVSNSKAIKAFNKEAQKLLETDNVGDYRKAAAALDSSLDIRSKDRFAVCARAAVAGILAAEHGDTAELAKANELLERAKSAGYESKDLFLAQGLSLVAAGKVAEAEAAMNKIIESGLAPGEVIAPLGMAHWKQGKPEQAASDLAQASGRDQKNRHWAALLGEAAFDAGDYPTAAIAFGRGLNTTPAKKEEQPKPPHQRSIIGRTRLSVAVGDNLEGALKVFDEQLAATGELALSPGMKLRALTGKAEALLALGRDADALKAAQEASAAAVAGDVAAAHAPFVAGLAMAHLKQPNAADQFKKAIELNRGIGRFYFQGAAALAAAGEADAGKALLESYLKVNEKPGSDYTIAQGMLTVASGKAADGLKLLSEGLEINPRNILGLREAARVSLATEPRSKKANTYFIGARQYYTLVGVTPDFLAQYDRDVEAAYKKAGLAADAAQWVKAMAELDGLSGAKGAKAGK